jgi:hypothetical protein
MSEHGTSSVKQMARPRLDLPTSVVKELGKLRELVDETRAEAEAADARLRERICEIHAKGLGGMAAIAAATGYSKAYIGLLVRDGKAAAEKPKRTRKAK